MGNSNGIANFSLRCLMQAESLLLRIKRAREQEVTRTSLLCPNATKNCIFIKLLTLAVSTLGRREKNRWSFARNACLRKASPRFSGWLFLSWLASRTCASHRAHAPYVFTLSRFLGRSLSRSLTVQESPLTILRKMNS